MEPQPKRPSKKSKPRSDDGFEEWGGYMAAKVAKLTEQYTEIANNQSKKLSDIFNGVAIYVNGYTNPSAEELKYLMAAHGGIYQVYQIPSGANATTHIIASNLPNVKIKHLGSVPIVKATWITDSIESGKLLDYSKYLLYTNVNRNQPLIDFPVVNKPSDQKPVPSDPKSASLPRYEPKATKTAADPEFLAEFYNNSRLHLISTLGAEFKLLVSQLREKSDGKFPGKEFLKNMKKSSNSVIGNESVVMHIDMDCFFVSVGLRNKPELKGQPVAVTHAKGSQGGTSRSKTDTDLELSLLKKYYPNEQFDEMDSRGSMAEIASCSYEARQCGIKNGMFLGAALKLCPNLKTIPYDFQGYREVSKFLYHTIASYTLDIEAVSCDEMYVNIGPVLREVGIGVYDWSTHIRQEIMNATGCSCSTGFGANRLQARLATKKAKPCGQFYLEENLLEEYMTGIPVADLPGVGRATVAKLNEIGITTCGDVQAAVLTQLQSEIGQKLGSVIFDQAHGIDKKPLNFQHERKSVSADVNYGIRFKNKLEATNFLQSLSAEVCSRLLEINMRTRCVTLKLLVRAPDAPQETAKFLGCGICNSINRSTTTSTLIGDTSSIYREAKALFDRVSVPPEELRGVGIQLTRLEKLAPVNVGIGKFFSKPKEQEGSLTSEVKLESLKSKVEEMELAETSPVKKKIDQAKPCGSSKRGRPKGSSNLKTNSRKPPNSLVKYFQPQHQPSTSRQKESSLNNEIDLTVLNELPADVRAEIIREYNLDDQIKVGEEISEKRDAVRVTSKKLPLKTEPETSIFDTLSREDFKAMILNWLKSEEEPAEFDVAMISEHFKQLAIDRKIEMLKTILSFLYRHVTKLNLCCWHNAYLSIVNQVQEGMITRYGSTLLVDRKFACESHC